MSSQIRVVKAATRDQ